MSAQDQWHVRNPMMGDTLASSSSSSLPPNSTHGDEETSLLGHGSPQAAPASSSSLYLPSWMSPSSASSSAGAPPRVNAYPSLDGVGGGQEMTTFNSHAQIRPGQNPNMPPNPNYPVMSTYAMPSTGPLRPTPASVPVVPPPAPVPRESTMIEVESTFIEDLIAENSRLSQELEDLRKIMLLQEQQYQEALQMHRSAVPAQFSQASMPVMSPGGMAGVPLQSSSINPQTGVQTLQTTNGAPQGGTKNVCCGHCRKWLLVPVAANLIFCPNCERVNNCSLASPGQAVNR